MIRFSLNETPPPTAPIVLTTDEDEGVKIIFSILQTASIDTSSIEIGRTSQYLKLSVKGSDDVFCRIGLSDYQNFISLIIASNKLKNLILDDPRFAQVKESLKKFAKIPILYLEDIRLYAEEIISSYQWVSESSQGQEQSVERIKNIVKETRERAQNTVGSSDISGMDSGNAFEIAQKGMKLENSGKIDKAVKCYESAIEMGLDAPYYFERLCIYYRKQKDTKNELRILDKAIAVINGHHLDWFEKRKTLLMK